MKCYLIGGPEGKFEKKKKGRGHTGRYNDYFPGCMKHIGHLIQKVHKILNKINKSKSTLNTL